MSRRRAGLAVNTVINPSTNIYRWQNVASPGGYQSLGSNLNKASTCCADRDDSEVVFSDKVCRRSSTFTSIPSTQGFDTTHKRKNNLLPEGRDARSITPATRVEEYGHRLGALARGPGFPPCSRVEPFMDPLISQIWASPGVKLVFQGFLSGGNPSMASGKIKPGVGVSGHRWPGQSDEPHGMTQGSVWPP